MRRTLGADILKLCVEVGGCLTGEHGVGIEKRDLMGTQFTDIDLDQQRRHQIRLRSRLAAEPGQSVPAAAAGRMTLHAPADEAGFQPSSPRRTRRARR